MNFYQVRCQNRQIHKAKILKGGIRKLNQSKYETHGFRLFDKVKYDNKESVLKLLSRQENLCINFVLKFLKKPVSQEEVSA